MKQKTISLFAAEGAIWYEENNFSRESLPAPGCSKAG